MQTRYRDPRSGNIAADAEHVFENVGKNHTGATSCTLLIPAARSITTQIQIVVELFDISVLDLTAEVVRLQLRQLDLQTRGIRAADSLHAATAIGFNADLLVSTDEAVLNLDGKLVNTKGRKIIYSDTDGALQIL